VPLFLRFFGSEHNNGPCYSSTPKGAH
jgi:hypothetical protein